MRDITECKAAKAQIQAGNLAAMGQLGAGIVHELNQPLAAIEIFVEMMRSEPDQKIGDYAQELDLIAEQVARMARVADNVRGFAQRPTNPRVAAPVRTGGVLVVDDEEILRIAIEGVLKQGGWQVATTASGEGALTLLASFTFDVALVDLRMPGMSGVEMCRSVRERCPEMGLVAMSGYVTEEDREGLRELGVNDVLTKPMSPRVLAEALGLALRRRTQRRSERPSEPESTTALDCGQVQFLREVGKLHKIARIFVDREPKRVEQLRRAVRTSDCEETTALVHSLIGVAGAIGAYALVGFSRQLERMARENASNECRCVLESLEDEFQRVEVELQGILDEA